MDDPQDKISDLESRCEQASRRTVEILILAFAIYVVVRCAWHFTPVK